MNFIYKKMKSKQMMTDWLLLLSVTMVWSLNWWVSSLIVPNFHVANGDFGASNGQRTRLFCFYRLKHKDANHHQLKSERNVNGIDSIDVVVNATMYDWNSAKIASNKMIFELSHPIIWT